jgi:uncharacterized damage-inducible protein DinB
MDGTATALRSALSDQRAHVLGILDGLSEEALLRPVLPSGWSCLSLVQHLTLDVERFWLREVMAGQEAEGPEQDGWVLGSDASAAGVRDRYRREIEAADAVIAAMPLDRPPAAWPDFFGDWRLPDLQSVLLHVITETACHAGHLDAARELVDGRQWLVLHGADAGS